MAVNPTVRKLRHRLLQVVAPGRLGWDDNFRPQWVMSGSGSITAGTRTYWAGDATFTAWKASDSITIGSYCSIASRVVLLAGGNHDVAALSTYPFTVIDRWTDAEAEAAKQPAQHLVIGNDVWIAAGAMVVGDITVGDGAVIAAGAVVVDDVAPYAVVAGVPARVIRQRFADEEVSILRRVRWWEWPEPDVLAAETVLRARDVAALEGFARERGLLGDEVARDPMPESHSRRVSSPAQLESRA